MMRIVALLVLVLWSWVAHICFAVGDDGLTSLDGLVDPYYPHRGFPKLITPQWVGEEGVECVVTLAIDDMRDPKRYEAFLRPILNRLKAIDGRAPVSIMTCRVDPNDPQLQAWLKEGLSIECHTYDHPCPLFQDGGLTKAKATYDQCVDLMHEIPGNRPVAFRVPCCDSKNTPTPRFWAEIFNKTTARGNFLQIDSSVFNLITRHDKELPREITELPDGSERFRRYVPFSNFVNTIEDYPYPYVIGGMCWEFPCVVPSDWSAQHVQGPNNPDTVRDWKLALDACVIKKGTFNLVFHPHGWIKAEQIVELIDHAVAKHGKKVKFLTFRECAERLNRHLFGGLALREETGRRGLAALYAYPKAQHVAVWMRDPPTMPVRGISLREWDAEKGRWNDPRRLDIDPGPDGLLQQFALQIDLDHDGTLEQIVGDGMPRDPGVYEPGPRRGGSKRLFGFPGGLTGPLAALRFVDVNGDGKLDCLFSNHERYSLYLFKDLREGWSIKVFDVVRGTEDGSRGSPVPVIPPFVRADGTNNGAWFHSGALWLMNEDTWRLPDHVFKLTFAQMLAAASQAAPGGAAHPTTPESQRQAPQASPPPAPQAAPPKADGAAGAPPASAASGASPTGQTAPARSAQQQAAATSAAASGASLAGPDFEHLEMTPPRSPTESLAVLHARPGMQVELVASEPLVVDPVAFDWGPDGRLWVVEMRDYPNGITWRKEGDELGRPGGRIKVLRDEDGDGRYDTARIFLDEIPFPTGVKVWREGILVTAAPSIFYAEDRDGDERADMRIELYRGFGEGNQQHRVNGLRWGLDNWLHVGNGDSGGVIEAVAALRQARAAWLAGGASAAGSAASASFPAAGSDRTRVNVNGRDLRIRPDEGWLDPTSGNTQFGRERDDWDNWFGGNNSNPIWHYVLDDYYLRRNPYVTYPSVRKAVSVTPGAAPVFPRSQTLARFNDFAMANRFTSACSPMIYRDELLGPEYQGNYFVCEPVHNLVHREPMQRQGATFVSRRADDEQTSEFLASEDHWFRPSMCRTGPDGALWVADMYRFVIEHPKWIPDAAQKKLDLRAGDEMGRIYRVFPAGRRPRPILRLDQLDTAGLVAALDTPNGPQRDLAHQMLLWRQDRSAIEPLRRLATQATRPQVRLQALAVLDGFNALSPEVIRHALADEHPLVRRHAVRLAETRWQAAPELLSAVLDRLEDPDPLVQMQLAYALGQSDHPRAAQALARLLASPAADDPYLAAAALSSVGKHNLAVVLTALLRLPQPPADRLEKLAAVVAAVGDEAIFREALAALRPGTAGLESWQLAAAGGLIGNWQRRQGSSSLTRDPSLKHAVEEILDAARQLAQRDGEAESRRVAALELLSHAGSLGRREDADLLQQLVAPQQPPRVQAAAASALASRRDPPTLHALLARWSSYSPALRSQILDSLLGREDGALAVLEAIRQGTIEAGQLDARRRQQLLTARSSAVRQQAENVLSGAIDPDRQKLIDTYLPAVAGGGDASRGKELFVRRCAQCHRLQGLGVAVGPDLAPLTTRPVDYWLMQILDPNRAVEDRYREYLVQTTDGRQLQGLLVEETGAGLVLLAPEGKSYPLARSEVEQLRSSGKSLMPEGMERDLSPADMADLVAFVRASAPPPKQLPGNRPEVVTPFSADGSLRLLATNARIYGPTLTLEEKYRNLGWWTSPEDHAVWTFELPPDGAGSYRVTLDYACAASAAGNVVLVEVAGQTLSAVVPATGSWEEFHGLNLGTVQLPAGRGELVVRSGGPIKQALLDLRSVRLIPVR